MSYKSDHEIERIGQGLMGCTLLKSDWTHAAHFAAACWLLRHPTLDASAATPGLIQAYNESTGVANTDRTGYHETITRASLRVARAWLASRPHVPLYVAINDLLASEYGRSDWLLRHWSRQQLFGITARRSWLEPDLSPLPF